MFDKDFFATALPVAIGHYMAGGKPAGAPQVRLLVQDGSEYVVRRALAAAEGWVSLEVVEEDSDGGELNLVFVPYEAIRRVVFDPNARVEERLGFRVHKPGEIQERPQPSPPGATPTPSPAPAAASGRPPGVQAAT